MQNTSFSYTPSSFVNDFTYPARNEVRCPQTVSEMEVIRVKSGEFGHEFPPGFIQFVSDSPEFTHR